MSPYRTHASPPVVHFARTKTIPICSYGLPWRQRLRLWLFRPARTPFDEDVTCTECNAVLALYEPDPAVPGPDGKPVRVPRRRVQDE